MEITSTDEPKSNHRRFPAACPGLCNPMFISISKTNENFIFKNYLDKNR